MVVAAGKLFGVLERGKLHPRHTVLHDDLKIALVGAAVLGGAEHPQVPYARGSAIGPGLDVVEIAVLRRDGAVGLDAAAIAGTDRLLHGLGRESALSPVVQNLAITAEDDGNVTKLGQALAQFGDRNFQAVCAPSGAAGHAEEHLQRDVHEEL